MRTFYIIIECKKKNRKDGLSQLKDYLRLSRAYLGVWFNGEERLYLRKIEKGGKVDFVEIPNIPRFGERIEDIGKFRRKELRPASNLKPTFKSVIFIPKYYDPLLRNELEALNNTHYLPTIGELIDAKILSVSTGDGIGKMAYGTGDIPFIRTSDIVNWEIKAIPKQGVSNEIYQQYAAREDVKVGDILLVKDGTYLIGTNCFKTFFPPISHAAEKYVF